MPKASVALPVPPKPTGEVPHLFGYGLRDRLLMTLAVNKRPMYVAELAFLLQSDHGKVRKTMLPLLNCGVLLKDDRPKGARYVGLNTAWPAYLQLLRLLRVLEERHPQPRLRKPFRKAERFALHDLLLEPNDSEISASQLDGLFYTAPRTRVLLGIAAIGDTDATDLKRTFNLDNRSTWNVVNHWQKEGVIRSVIRGRRRAVELDPSYSAARELRLLLRRLIETTQEYRVLSEFSSRRLGSHRFVALR